MKRRDRRSELFGVVNSSTVVVVLAVICFGSIQIESRAACTQRTTPTPIDGGDYDFIVAGGGTGGAIVAARLSENFHVLLLESGERLYDDAKLSAKYLMPVMLGTDIASVVDAMSPFIKAFGSLSSSGDIYDEKGAKVGSLTEGIPGFMPHIQATPFLALYMTMTEATHYYPTVPQIYSQKREIDYPRGNVLGGSSAANTMVYYKGSSRDYDQWSQDFGLKGGATGKSYHISRSSKTIKISAIRKFMAMVAQSTSLSSRTISLRQQAMHGPKQHLSSAGQRSKMLLIQRLNMERATAGNHLLEPMGSDLILQSISR